MLRRSRSERTGAAIHQAGLNSLDEIKQNVGAAVLGLTVGCARCLNHKFDPISARDHHRLVATFSGVHYDDRPWRRDDDAARAGEQSKVFAGRFTAAEPVHLLLRGDPSQPTVPVGQGGLEVLGGVELAVDTPERDCRVALARWLVGDAAPLVAREIVMSTTYRQDSRPVAAAVAVDPDTRLLRYPPQRLDAESIHDAMLSAAGVLDLSMGGQVALNLMNGSSTVRADGGGAFRLRRHAPHRESGDRLPRGVQCERVSVPPLRRSKRCRPPNLDNPPSSLRASRQSAARTVWRDYEPSRLVPRAHRRRRPSFLLDFSSGDIRKNGPDWRPVAKSVDNKTARRYK